MKLNQAPVNEEVVIVKVLGHGSFRNRISEMGFVKGKVVKKIKSAPFHGPLEIKVLNSNISIRYSEAELIEVLPIKEIKKKDNEYFNGVIERNLKLINNSVESKTINIALIGNPNSGKTTLFNNISESKQKVGNYSGVTVDVTKATVSMKGYTINIFDLPGTYSLTAYSYEEIFVREFIYKHTPDIIINVVDAGNLERNLFLTTQLIDMDLRVVMALNMYDEMEKMKIDFEHERLAKLIGMPIVPTVSSKGVGIDNLFNKVIEVYEGTDKITRHIHINYGFMIEEAIKKIRDKIKENAPVVDQLSSRFISIKLLEKDEHMQKLLSIYKNSEDILNTTRKEIRKIESIKNEDSETVITDAKYGFISGALKESYKQEKTSNLTTSEKIDKFLTDKILGLPIFLGILYIMFYATFNLGAIPMDWIDSGVSTVGNFVSNFIGEGVLRDLLVDGIISGTGSVLVFLPNILILFFFISMLEETGYMARAAYIMDNVMHRFGLHGRSFIPLIMGFGCNVPAIIATRTMKSKNQRLLTMMIIPFMSCSARLPVYILIISAFFNSYQSLILIGLYALGIFFAFLTAQLLNITVFKNKETPFVMELPPYRFPTIRNILYQMWEKTKHYIKKIGTVILVGVIIIWALEYFPRTTEKTEQFEQQITQIQQNKSISTIEKENKIESIERSQETDRLVNSYLGRFGKVIEPVMRPLGFDWKMSISLLAGLPAKEIVISTMGVIYETPADEDTINLQKKLQAQRFESGKKKGQKVFTIPTALAFLVFILLYFPCIGVVATIKNEAKSWKWAIFSVIYTTSLAWLTAFAVQNLASLYF